VANLSYILFGVTLMTPAGLQAGVLHMLFHSLIKICAFFAAGAVLHSTKKQYITAIGGMGRKMPLTFTCFTVAALSLTGIPLFNGFLSKWALAEAALEAGGTLEFVGVIVLLISALLTGVYMLGISSRAFFPSRGNEVAVANVREVSPLMTVPMLILAASCIALGLFSQPLIDLIAKLLA
jgi:multicomponent Na+:H+ antiporter subunit D